MGRDYWPGTHDGTLNERLYRSAVYIGISHHLFEHGGDAMLPRLGMMRALYCRHKQVATPRKTRAKRHQVIGSGTFAAEHSRRRAAAKHSVHRDWG